MYAKHFMFVLGVIMFVLGVSPTEDSDVCVV